MLSVFNFGIFYNNIQFITKLYLEILNSHLDAKVTKAGRNKAVELAQILAAGIFEIILNQYLIGRCFF
jgi:hypothetical protein